MKKKTSFKKITRRIIVGMAAFWLILMGIITYVTAKQIQTRLYIHSREFADLICDRNLRCFYDQSDARYGTQYEHPEYLEYEMLDAVSTGANYNLQVPGSITYFGTDEGINIRFKEYPMETAVLVYDAEGQLMFSSEDDLMMFSYAAKEDWDKGQLVTASGYMDLNDDPKGDGTLLRSVRELFKSSINTNLYYGYLRVAGYFEGIRLIPVVIDYISQEEITSVMTAGYSVMAFDQQGTIEWKNIYDASALVGDKTLETVYLSSVRTWDHKKEPLKYNGQRYESLGEFADKIYTYMSGNDTNNTIRPTGPEMIDIPARIKLGQILMVNGWSFFDRREGSGTAGESKRDFTVITAERSSPLTGAVRDLVKVYAWSLFALCILTTLILLMIRRHVTGPAVKMIEAMEENTWNIDPPVKDSSVLWPDTARLKALFEEVRKEKKADEQEIRRLDTALNYARNAEQSRREMTSGMAHELKTPLAVIRSYAEALKEHIAEEKRDKYIDVILEETDRTDAMVLSMLELSRLEAGKVKLSRDEFSLNEVTDNVIQKFEKTAEERQLRISFEPGEEAMITADEARITEVVENLVSNAVKYTDEGGRINISIKRELGKTCFRIENDCEPLTEEALTKVWDSFYRVDESRKRGGTGLGLTIVKNIVLLHGGTCQVRNTEHGVEFSFTI